VPYAIVFKCRGCGGVLEVGRGAEHVKGGSGRHVGIVTTRRVYEAYEGVCPYCGRELALKPERLEFKTLGEHGEYLSTDASTLIRTMTFKVPAWIEEAVERLVREGAYRSKSQFLRRAVLKLLEEHGVKP
jgi:hypothetical protein